MPPPRCLACSATYDAAEHSPMVLGQCGHSLCLSCIKQIAQMPSSEQRCPTCRERVDPSNSTPNHALRDTLAAMAPPLVVQTPPSPQPEELELQQQQQQQQQQEALLPPAICPSPHEACPTHGDRIRFLCATHNSLCCATCFLEDHEDCDRHPLESARQQLEKRIIAALNDMRESGEKLQTVQMSLAERSSTLMARRETVKTEVRAFFAEYARDVERRRDTLLSQADAYFDSVDSTVQSRLTYLNSGLMFLEGLFQEMSSLRKASMVEFLLQGPTIATKMENAVVEAKGAVGPIEELARSSAPTPFFAPPSNAVLAAGLATIKVLDGQAPPSPQGAPPGLASLAVRQSSPVPQPQPPPAPAVAVASPRVQAVESRPMAKAPAPDVAQASPRTPVAAPKPAGPVANGGAAKPVAKPVALPPGHVGRLVEAKPANGGAAVANGGGEAWAGKAKKAGTRPDIHDDADFPPLEPTGKAGDDDWLVASAEKKREEKEKKKVQVAAAKPAAQPQQGGAERKEPAKPAKKYVKPIPGVPFSAEKPQICVMNNITNNGMDGFLHLHPPDGSYYAIYYNFIGKVATLNQDGSDPKKYKKGEKFVVELKDNPFEKLAEEKPERKYVASAMRRL